MMVLLLVIFHSCTNGPDKPSSQQSDPKARVAAGDSLIPFDALPGDSSKHPSTSLQKCVMPLTIRCTGVVEVHPQHRMRVTAPVKGFVRELRYLPGERIKRGEVVARLSHPGYLDIQQRYLSVKSRLKYQQQEYQRQGELAVDEAASLKKVQQARARYGSLQVELQSLEEQLQLLHVDPEELSKDGLNPVVDLVAPISGRISKTGIQQGELAHGDHFIYEIIRTGHMRLKLRIHERYSQHVKAGQKIMYAPQPADSLYLTAQVRRTGIIIDPEKRTFNVFASIDQSRGRHKEGRQVEATVKAGKDTMSVVTNDALVHISGQPHLLITTQKGYRMVRVETGPSQGNHTAIKNAGAFRGKRFARHAAQIVKKIDSPAFH